MMEIINKSYAMHSFYESQKQNLGVRVTSTHWSLLICPVFRCYWHLRNGNEPLHNFSTGANEEQTLNENIYFFVIETNTSYNTTDLRANFPLNKTFRVWLDRPWVKRLSFNVRTISSKLFGCTSQTSKRCINAGLMQGIWIIATHVQYHLMFTIY